MAFRTRPEQGRLTASVRPVAAVVWLAAAVCLFAGCRGKGLGSASGDSSLVDGGLAVDGSLAADAKIDGTMSLCSGDLRVDLLLPNDSVGYLAASDNGRYLGILADFDWYTGTGDLVVHDLSSSDTIEIAGSVPRPVLFLPGSRVLYYRYRRSITGGSTWDMIAFDLETRESVEVGWDLLHAVFSPDMRQAALVQPGEPDDNPYGRIVLCNLDEASCADVDQGEGPCIFELGEGPVCLVPEMGGGRLFYISNLDAAGSFYQGGDLRSIELAAPSSSILYEREVEELTLHADGRILSYVHGIFFDEESQEYRADVDLEASDQSFRLPVFVAEMWHLMALAVSPQGSTFTANDPAQQPTSVTVRTLPQGETILVEQEVGFQGPLFWRTMLYYPSEGCLALLKPAWTGSEMDNALHFLSLEDPGGRVVAGQSMRRYFPHPELGLFLFIHHPPSMTLYQGQVGLSAYRYSGGVSLPYPASEHVLPSLPCLVEPDPTGELLVYVRDYHDNWQGRLGVAHVDSEEIFDLSATANAREPLFMAGGYWLAYLEQAGTDGASYLNLAARPFNGQVESFGADVSDYLELASECLVVAFTNCTKPHYQPESCLSAVKGVYIIREP